VVIISYCLRNLASRSRFGRIDFSQPGILLVSSTLRLPRDASVSLSINPAMDLLFIDQTTDVHLSGRCQTNSTIRRRINRHINIQHVRRRSGLWRNGELPGKSSRVPVGWLKYPEDAKKPYSAPAARILPVAGQTDDEPTRKSKSLLYLTPTSLDGYLTDPFSSLPVVSNGTVMLALDQCKAD
jgi:hypothetical protein